MTLGLYGTLDSFVTFTFSFKFLESSFIVMWKDWHIIHLIIKKLYVNLVWLFSVCCVGCGRYHRIDQHRQWHDSPLQQPDAYAAQYVRRRVYEGLSTRVSGIRGRPSHPHQGQGESSLLLLLSLFRNLAHCYIKLDMTIKIKHNT